MNVIFAWIAYFTSLLDAFLFLTPTSTSSETRSIMTLNGRRLCDDAQASTGNKCPLPVRAAWAWNFSPCFYFLPPFLLLSTTGGWSFLQYKPIRVCCWMMLWKDWECITKMPTNPQWLTIDRIFGSATSIINPCTVAGYRNKVDLTCSRNHTGKRDDTDKQTADSQQKSHKHKWVGISVTEYTDTL